MCVCVFVWVLRHILKSNRSRYMKFEYFIVYEKYLEKFDFGHFRTLTVVQGQMYTIPQNLAPNVNLSYCLDLMTLGSKFKKNSCWTFFQ